MISKIIAWLKRIVKNDELPPYGCRCVLPWHHCPDCEAAARQVYGSGDDELPF